MKRFVSIILLIGFLNSTTELHQLLKLPMLIHHFFDHNKQEPTESFAEFIKEHYITHIDHSDKDNHEHDNLPFKTKDCATIHTTIAFSHQQTFFIKEPNTSPQIFLIEYNEVNYSPAALSNIWQPPKIS